MVAYGIDVLLECSAFGSSFVLTWYKGKQNGTRNDWQEIVSKKEDTIFDPYTGKRESKQTLLIKKFNVSNNGVYRCHLRRYYVKWTAHVEKYVGIKGIYLSSACSKFTMRIKILYKIFPMWYVVPI